MAINTKAQLKALVTAGILTSELMNNIIDSQLDLSGTINFDDDEIVVSANGVERIRIDENGNIAYNGATIPSGLSANFEYTFSNQICTMKSKLGGLEIICNGCYGKTATDYYAIANTGRYPMITYVGDSSAGNAIFRIRQSIVEATAIDAPLGNIFADGTTVTPS